MTRETKVGLVVAASFLSLVGGVLAVKYTQGRLPAAKKDDAPAVAANTPKSTEPEKAPEAPAKDPTPPAEKTDTPPSAPVPLGTPGDPAAKPEPAAPPTLALPSPGAVASSTNANNADPAGAPVLPVPTATPSKSKDEEDFQPLGKAADPKADAAKKPTAADNGGGLVVPTPNEKPAAPPTAKLELPTTPAPALKPDVKPAAPPAPIELPMPGGAATPTLTLPTPTPAPMTPAPMTPAPMTPAAPMLPGPVDLPRPEAAKPAVPEPKTETLPSITLPGTPAAPAKDTNPAKPPDSGLNIGGPAPARPEPKADPTAKSPPGLDLSPPPAIKPDGKPEPKAPDLSLPPPPPAIKLEPKTDSAAPRPPMPEPPLPVPPMVKQEPKIEPKVEAKPEVKPAAPPTSPPPALGSPRPAATIDPRGVAPATGPEAVEPRQDSYEEEWYSCQGGETLEDISQRVYFTKKYAEALRRYNLDRQQSDNLRAERPVMTARQTVRIPPARILERLYPAAVPGLKAQPAAGTPVGMSGGRPSFEPVSATGGDLGSAPTYTVQGKNKTLRDIAKEQLGNSALWYKIFELNRSLNPNEPVPEGTMIYLPRATVRQ